jgi:putative copper resistance protein D
MGSGVETVHHLVTALLNLAVAVLTGATLARSWLSRDACAWAGVRRRPVRNVALAAAAAALAADIAWLWLESALMAEVPVLDAGSATWTMATSTHLGLAWCIGLGALAVGAACSVARDGRTPWPTMAALAVFWYTRSMAGHAASDGDASVRLLADWARLGLVSVWIGEVIVSGGVILRTAGDLTTTADTRARTAYATSLSNSATIALAGIVVTGLYAAWRNVRGIGDLVGNPYGDALTAKLLLVGVAALLGGFNRLAVMPSWLAAQATRPALSARFKHILWIEAAVLTGAVVLAAWLASASPPGEST